MRLMVHNASTDDPLIVDVCSGTGSTAVAAQALELSSVSFETSKVYRDVIRARLR
eukprot:Nk52_evm1s1684 gene=Nk52_evmTU1s1684